MEQLQFLFSDNIENFIEQDKYLSVRLKSHDEVIEIIQNKDNLKDINLIFKESKLQYNEQQEIIQILDNIEDEDSIIQFVSDVINTIDILYQNQSGLKQQEAQQQQEDQVEQYKIKKIPVPVSHKSCKIENYKQKIYRTEPKIVLKSYFIGLGIIVKNQEDVDQFIDFVNSTQEFCDATHNMATWRFQDQNGQIIEGYDEDGEHAAGKGMLFILQQKQITNMCIICSRFWGGILLGSQRFRIINQVVQDCIQLIQKDM